MHIRNAGALVVGGASGLGEATVRRLNETGAVVTIADVNEDRGKALAAELGIEFVACDVREEDQVEAAVNKAAEADGGLRIAVTCAGTGWAQKVASSKGPHPLEPFKIILEINLIGTFNVLRLAAQSMIDNEPLDGDRGLVIMTASVAAYDGQIGQAAYAASKGGIASLTLTAARDLADKAIRVMTIAPGVMETPMMAGLPGETKSILEALVPHPARLGRPEEYAMLVEAIIANPLLNGEVIRLDGALRMPPR